MLRRSALVLALFSALPACRMVAVDPGPVATSEQPLLAGDRLRLAHADGSTKEVVVAADGTVVLADGTVVDAAGRSARALARALVEEGRTERVEVAALAPSIEVRGSVERPGRAALSGDLTVFEAVMRAGPSATADLAHVTLYRGAGADHCTITANLDRMLEAGDTTHNVLVLDGDRLVVPATLTGSLLP